MYTQEYSYDVTNDFNKYLAKTFLTVALGFAIASISAFVLVNYFIQFINRGTMMIAVFAQLGLVMSFGFRITKMSSMGAWLNYILYCLCTGFTFSLILLAFEFQSIILCFAITSVVFASMSVIALTTKIDFTKFSSYFVIGLLSIIGISILNIFIRSEGLNLMLLYGGTLLFLGITAYDVQKIRQMYRHALYDNRLLNNFMIYSAFTLFIDFVNLFIYTLRIFGSRRD